jgi:sulfoxide reductase catalytic subunit YedY
MLIRKPTLMDGSAIPSSEITPERDFVNRRSLLKAAVAGASALALSPVAKAAALPRLPRALNGVLSAVQGSLSTHGEQWTSLEDISHYTNFYEFGSDKHQPADNAEVLPTRPWAIEVSGLVQKPRKFDIDALLKLRPLEERVYRHRCVEGWSMVIPWVGYSLSELIKECQPLSTAKYVQFVSYYNPKVAVWAADCKVPWPYTEALRMDEAMNPLTLLTVGLYGNELPKQNGAPVRVMIPWKYGYKSPKSVVAIRFVDHQPATTWNQINSDMYGFYSNVNPAVEHPRWNQKNERRIGRPFWAQRQGTMLFNGYGDFVAPMYKGMDLNKNY